MQRKIIFEKKPINKQKLLEENSKKIGKIVARKKENIYKNYKFFYEKTGEINYEKKVLSGFFISKDGKILTNKHILCNNCSYFAFFNNKKYDLEIQKIFEKKDLVIFKIIGNKKNFSYININKLEKNKKLENKKIFLINYKKQVLVGKILKKIEKFEYIDRFANKKFFFGLLQTNLKSDFGDSGSPVFDEFGNLIGINSFFKDNKNYIIILDKNEKKY